MGNMAIVGLVVVAVLLIVAIGGHYIVKDEDFTQ